MKSAVALSPTESKTLTWSKQDSHWVFSLFGTAVGAGILFLPINLGIGGFWPLLILAALAYPMTYLAHRGLARFVHSSANAEADFTDVVDEHFGARFGRLVTLLYFLSIFPILMIYGVAITNTTDSFLVNQLGMASPPRALLSGGLIFALIAIMIAGEKVLLKSFEVMVYPLAGILGLLSLYLIPHWQTPALSMPSAKDFMTTLWLAIPVVVFSFSYTPAVSYFAKVQRQRYGAHSEAKTDSIMRRTTTMLVGFVLLFVFSCVLTLSPAQLAQAKAENVSILSYLANIMHNPVLGLLGPLVAFIAITSSFLGHFLGARESLNGLLTKNTSLSLRHADKLSIVILFLAIWFSAIQNPSILGVMEALSGPVIAIILFIMPVYAVYNVKSLHAYRHRFGTYFTLAVGLLAVSALVFNLLF
ncbi:aromatic amino acid transport family protein [Plesiomonas shigelloides]|uniref:aromatic amino acid transport family protein n=1 Tax=Plesiomonas shigelloides TaxID=703 RepID=UPI0030BABD92